MSPSVVLISGLTKYKHKDAAKTDIERAMDAYPSMRVKIQPFTFDDGVTRDLVSLDGTLPVNIQGKIYNIPMAVFFLPTHPHMPPLAYVRPTPTMEIKAGKHVDPNGRIYLPYLSEWKAPTSQTNKLLEILQDIFASASPVYAKPLGSQSQTQSTASNVVGFQAYPPVPGGSVANGFAPGLFQSVGHLWPSTVKMPPIPTVTAPTPLSMPGIPQHGSSSGSNLFAYQNPIGEDPILTSLRSAVLDKLKREQQELINDRLYEIQALQSTQHDLQSGNEKLKMYMARIKSEVAQVNQTCDELRVACQEAKDTHKKLKKEADTGINFDEAIDATVPVYRQLVNAFAEEQAIDDIIYYLGKGLHDKVVNVDEFLKAVRELSRKQFMLRAIVFACREKAGLLPV